MADDSLWVCCKLRGKGVPFCKLSMGYGLYRPVPSEPVVEFMNYHHLKCGMPVDCSLYPPQLAQAQFGFFIEEDLTSMAPQDPPSKTWVGTLREELRITLGPLRASPVWCPDCNAYSVPGHACRGG